MSKQSEAKEKQGYVAKAVPMTCANCVHFNKEVKEMSYLAFSGLRTWPVDKNLRCGIGGFAVKKSGTCTEFCGKSE